MSNSLPRTPRHAQSRRKDPPYAPVGGASRMLRGLMLRRRAVLGTPKCEKSVGRRGSAPDPAGGAYSAPPDPLAGGEGLRGGFAAPSPRNPLTILSLCLFCVYVHQACRGYGYPWIYPCIYPWIYPCVDMRLGPGCGYIHGYYAGTTL